MDSITKPPLTILIGENEEDQLRVLVARFKALGHIVVGEAKDGITVIDQLKKLKQQGDDKLPDALWLDIGMEPGDEGGLTCAEDAWRRFKVRTVIHTGKDDPQLIEDIRRNYYIIEVVIKDVHDNQYRAALGKIRQRKTDRESDRMISRASALLAKPGDPDLDPGLSELYEISKATQLPLEVAAEYLLKESDEIKGIQKELKKKYEEVKRLEEHLRRKREEFLKKYRD